MYPGFASHSPVHAHASQSSGRASTHADVEPEATVPVPVFVALVAATRSARSRAREMASFRDASTSLVAAAALSSTFNSAASASGRCFARSDPRSTGRRARGRRRERRTTPNTKSSSPPRIRRTARNRRLRRGDDDDDDAARRVHPDEGANVRGRAGRMRRTRRRTSRGTTTETATTTNVVRVSSPGFRVDVFVFVVERDDVSGGFDVDETAERAAATTRAMGRGG